MTDVSLERKSLVRVVDLEVGESAEVELWDGTRARVTVVAVEESRDRVRGAVRLARVSVNVNGEMGEVVSGNYELPILLGGVQIDSPVTKGYVGGEKANPWGLDKAVRLRLWPAGSAWMEAGTFVYPVKQRWFAGPMQTGNEPVYVDGVESPTRERIYYHDGLDFGGAEREIEVISATDGVVTMAGTQVIAGGDEVGSKGAYDAVVVRDGRGWYVRYYHLTGIEAGIRPGVRVTMGQKIGLIGKEGGSGGWSHLHFDIQIRQPSGRFGTEPAYLYAWEAWQREGKPEVIAVARPHRFGLTGEEIELDGGRSWSKGGGIARYEWSFCDGGKAEGAKVKRRYERPGTYSETLKVTNEAGRVAHDFAVVEILNKEEPAKCPPGIHAAFSPTMGIKAGDAVSFQVRTFGTTFGEETWDFGDGSERVKTKSDGNAVKYAKDGYARTVHRFARAGEYLVSVMRENERGERAVGRLWVTVGG